MDMLTFGLARALKSAVGVGIWVTLGDTVGPADTEGLTVCALIILTLGPGLGLSMMLGSTDTSGLKLASMLVLPIGEIEGFRPASQQSKPFLPEPLMHSFTTQYATPVHSFSALDNAFFPGLHTHGHVPEDTFGFVLGLTVGIILTSTALIDGDGLPATLGVGLGVTVDEAIADGVKLPIGVAVKVSLAVALIDGLTAPFGLSDGSSMAFAQHPMPFLPFIRSQDVTAHLLIRSGRAHSDVAFASLAGPSGRQMHGHPSGDMEGVGDGDGGG